MRGPKTVEEILEEVDHLHEKDYAIKAAEISKNLIAVPNLISVAAKASHWISLVCYMTENFDGSMRCRTCFMACQHEHDEASLDEGGRRAAYDRAYITLRESVFRNMPLNCVLSLLGHFMCASSARCNG